MSLIAASLILGLAGPFGTDGYMRLGPRFAYWAVVVFTTFPSGAFVSIWAIHFTRKVSGPSWMVPLIASVGSGVSVSVIIVVLNWLALGVTIGQPGYLPFLLINTLSIAIIVALLFYFLGDRLETSDPTLPNSSPSPSTPRILSRLPLDKRGALISMSVSDHYVEITTTKGQELVLMRLSDAIGECAPANGMQVHRSHWVALDQITAAKRAGDRAILTMSDGRDIPVSRSYVPAVKDAGILPK